MSVDVNYYSFSPSRADEQWPNFVEDVSVLRKKHATWHKYEEDTDRYHEKAKEIKTHYELLLKQIRKKIFNHFNDKGFVIPWVEWGQEYGTDEHGMPCRYADEDKMEYLKIYGCVYPRGTNIHDKNHPYLMLRTDAPELEEEYDKIISERDEAIAGLTRATTITPSEDKGVVLNKRQGLLDSGTDLSYLKYENVFDEESLINSLKELDIYYGSVSNEYFEEPKLEYFILENLIKAYHLKTEDKLPTKDEWIRLFQNLISNNFQEACVELMKEMDWDKDAAEWTIKDYLRSVRSVVKDLKKTPDSFFFRFYGGDIEVEPLNAESLLTERARIHAEKYKGLLKPVL